MIKILSLGTDLLTIYDQDENEVSPYTMDKYGNGYVIKSGVSQRIQDVTGKKKYSIMSNACYTIVQGDISTDDAESLLHSARMLKLRGYVSYKILEQELLVDAGETSDERLDIFSSMYATPEVMKEYCKEYGSDMHIGGVTIAPSRLRVDKRVFGLKFADPGEYKNLVYLDFHNFYPNLMLEIGCPPRMSREKIITLLSNKKCKFTLNKLIGRMDLEYSIFYDPQYANDLRSFGRLKLLYYISKTKKLVLTNTDSILADVDIDFELPDNVTSFKVPNAIIKNIGNYVLRDENDEYHTAGIFNKVEELAVAKLRMGVVLESDELKVDSLFHNGQQGYLSVNDEPIIGLDRKCKYGVSKRLSVESLIRYQIGY